MTVQKFTDLIAWQKAYDLAIHIYRATDNFPKHEQFGLTSQLRRAAVSVSSNIAEGFGRSSIKEKDQFYSIARGSLVEVQNQLMISKGVGYLEEENYVKLEDRCIIAIKVLSGLQKTNKQKGLSS